VSRRRPVRDRVHQSRRVAPAVATDGADAQVLVARGDRLARVVLELLEALPVHAREHRQRRTELPPEEVVDGHAGTLAHDVPQRAVDRAHGIAGIDAGAPVRRLPRHLPDVFDLVHVPADDRRLEEPLDRRRHDELSLGMTAAPDAVEPGLTRRDLDVGQVVVADLRQDGLDVGDFETG
jgi:hypothetical protein